MDNRDKDYRYMACSDLNTELSKVGFRCQPAVAAWLRGDSRR